MRGGYGHVLEGNKALIRWELGEGGRLGWLYCMHGVGLDLEVYMHGDGFGVWRH